MKKGKGGCWEIDMAAVLVDLCVRGGRSLPVPQVVSMESLQCFHPADERGGMMEGMTCPSRATMKRESGRRDRIGSIGED